MPIDLGHFARRFLDPFNAESRFYWPLVIGLGLAIVANVVWYYWPKRPGSPPAELGLRAWSMWINLIAIVWILVLLVTKVPFYVIAASFALNAAILVYLYAFWLPPREAAWLREQRRQQYIPKPEHRKRRRRR